MQDDDSAPHVEVADFLTVPELAKLLRVNAKTIYAEIASGRIHAVRLGRALRIPRATIEALSDGKAQAPP
jgi:excisionase family DNA binding protein